MKREPTLIIQTISALLGVLVALGWDALTAPQAAAIIAVISAAAGAVNAWRVRPVAPAVYTGLVTAVAVLLAAYGLEVRQEVLAAVQVAVTAVLALITREQVTPEPVTGRPV